MSGQTTQVGSQRTWTGRLIVVGIILAVVLLFVALNSNKVNVDFLVFDTDIRLGWALLIAAALGFLAGLIVPRFRSKGP